MIKNIQCVWWYGSDAKKFNLQEEGSVFEPQHLNGNLRIFTRPF